MAIQVPSLNSLQAWKKGQRSDSVWMVVLLVLFAAGLRILTLRYVMFGVPSDDAYIFMRYSENIAKGIGPFYNQGEPVMGFTSPLFTYAIAALKLVGLGLPLVILVTAFNLTLFLACTYLLARLTIQKSPWGWIPFIGWLFYFPFIVATVDGMESTLFLCCILGAVDAFQRDKYNNLLVWMAFALLTRPEGILLWMAGVWMLWTKRPKSVPWKGVAAASILLLGWLFYAVKVFGSPLPESMVAKSIVMSDVGGSGYASPVLVFTTQVIGAGSNSIRAAGRGVTILEAISLVGVALWLYGLAIALKRRAPEACLILLFGLLVAFYVAGKPVTISTWYTVVGCLCFWYSLGYLASVRLPERFYRPAIAAVAVFVLASIVTGVQIQKKGHKGFTGIVLKLANYFKSSYPQARSIMMSDIGIVGYETQLEVIDLDGLVSNSTMRVDKQGLISFGELAKTLKPDIISYPQSLDFVGTVTDGTVTRATFRNEQERSAFFQSYEPTPHDPMMRDYIYVRKDMLNRVASTRTLKN